MRWRKIKKEAAATFESGATEEELLALQDKPDELYARVEAKRAEEERKAAEEAQRIVDEIISTGSSSTPVIGVSLDTSFPGPGARVSEVTPGSGADEAGLLDGDVITAIDGDVIAESTELVVSIRYNAHGDSV